MMKTFFSKLLLFGEYGLMFGARALAVPFTQYYGFLTKTAEFPDKSSRKSSVELERFSSWFRHQQLNERMNFPIDLDELDRDIRANLFFRSNIPFEYGVGSSGALCAALFHEYSIYGEVFSSFSRKRSLPEALKEDFALMESYFHGKSSGLDPLVSFLGQPVLLKDGHISLPCIKDHNFSFSVYLMDTGQSGPTSPLVRLFLEKMKSLTFKDAFSNQYLPANDGAIESFLTRNAEELFVHLRHISDFQLKYLSEMIPPSCVGIIGQLRDKGISVKLLGSGGGGFLLVFVPGRKQPSILEKKNVMPIF